MVRPADCGPATADTNCPQIQHTSGMHSTSSDPRPTRRHFAIRSHGRARDTRTGLAAPLVTLTNTNCSDVMQIVNSSKPVCIQRRPSAVNMALPAFAAERRVSVSAVAVAFGRPVAASIRHGLLTVCRARRASRRRAGQRRSEGVRQHRVAVARGGKRVKIVFKNSRENSDCNFICVCVQ